MILNVLNHLFLHVSDAPMDTALTVLWIVTSMDAQRAGMDDAKDNAHQCRVALKDFSDVKMEVVSETHSIVRLTHAMEHGALMGRVFLTPINVLLTMAALLNSSL